MEDYLIACICEGGAEHAIMDILLENNLLKFNKQQLLDEKVIRTRSAKNFERDYLRKSFIEKITVYRILDSRNEEFKLSKLYKEKVKVVNVVTAPEIEMLIILSEDKFDEFKKMRIKPSEYCKQILRYSDVKSYQFISKYFLDVHKLVYAINMYHQKAKVQKDEKTLFDLLKS